VPTAKRSRLSESSTDVSIEQHQAQETPPQQFTPSAILPQPQDHRYQPFTPSALMPQQAQQPNPPPDFPQLRCIETSSAYIYLLVAPFVDSKKFSVRILRERGVKTICFEGSYQRAVHLYPPFFDPNDQDVSPPIPFSLSARLAADCVVPTNLSPAHPTPLGILLRFAREQETEAMTVSVATFAGSTVVDSAPTNQPSSVVERLPNQLSNLPSALVVPNVPAFASSPAASSSLFAPAVPSSSMDHSSLLPEPLRLSASEPAMSLFSNVSPSSSSSSSAAAAAAISLLHASFLPSSSSPSASSSSSLALSSSSPAAAVSPLLSSAPPSSPSISRVPLAAENPTSSPDTAQNQAMRRDRTLDKTELEEYRRAALCAICLAPITEAKPKRCATKTCRRGYHRTCAPFKGTKCDLCRTCAVCQKPVEFLQMVVRCRGCPVLSEYHELCARQCSSCHLCGSVL